MASYYGYAVNVRKIGNEKHFLLLIGRNTETEMKYATQVISDERLVNTINSGAIEINNLMTDGNKIIGRGASIARLEDATDKTVVVINKLAIRKGNSDEEIVVGYTVSNSSGRVLRVKREEFLKYCASVLEQTGKPPVQNMMFVSEGEATEHLRQYPECQIPTEILSIRKSASAKPAAVTATKPIQEGLFTKAQLQEIQIAKNTGLHWKLIARPEFSVKQMRALRKAMERGVDPTQYASPDFRTECMYAYTASAALGIDISNYVNPEFNLAQLSELETGNLEGIDISEYADPSIPAMEMSEKRMRLEMKVYGQIQAQEANVI